MRHYPPRGGRSGLALRANVSTYGRLLRRTQHRTLQGLDPSLDILNSGLPLLRKMGTIEARSRGRDSADRRVILTRSIMLRESLCLHHLQTKHKTTTRHCCAPRSSTVDRRYLTGRCKVSQNRSRMELEVRRNQEHLLALG